MYQLSHKIIVIGPSGSGKSTLAIKLSKILSLPIYHLDNIWWNKDKSHISRDEFDIKLSNILSEDNWIIDGDYSRTYEVRMEASKTIIYLDFPLEFCLKSVEDRVGQYRPDIPWVEDNFDPEFKEWIIGWFNKTRPRLLELIEKYKNNKQIIIFHNREEVEEFIKSI